MNDNEKFLQYVNSNYDYLQRKLKAWAFNTGRKFSEDIFQETIIKIYELITKNKKAKDPSDYGFECLFFRSFSTNTLRQAQYAYVKYRSEDITADTQIFDAYEDFKSSDSSPEEKVESDLFKDFATRYLLCAVEDNFDDLDYRLFRIKIFYQCTYKKLKELTKIKDAKQRCVKINNWLKSNIDRKDIEKAFEQYQDNL